MKILSIGPAHPLRGGIARFNESLAMHLQQDGNEVEIISYRFQYPALLFPGKSQYSNGEAPAGLRIDARIHSLSPFNWRRVSGEVIRRQPRLVIIHYWMPFFAPAMGYIAGRIKKKPGITVLLLAHNLIPHEHQPGTVFLTRRLLRNVNGLVALSGSVVRDAKKILPGLPAIVIPHPVYDSYGEKEDRATSLSHLGLSTGKKYILFFGLVRKYKGLDILLRALPLVKTEDLAVLVAGEFYDKKEEYLALADELNIRHMIILRDEYIPDDEVKYYFSAADLVVQPYRSATQSGVTQIAYHFEVPMVVSDVGGLPEIVEDGVTGFVVRPEPEEIAGAIDRFFFSPDKEKFIAGVRKRKKDFSWVSFTGRLLAFTGSLRRDKN